MLLTNLYMAIACLYLHISFGWMCMISLILFTDKYLGHGRTFYTNGLYVNDSPYETIVQGCLYSLNPTNIYYKNREEFYCTAW